MDPIELDHVVFYMEVKNVLLVMNVVLPFKIPHIKILVLKVMIDITIWEIVTVIAVIILQIHMIVFIHHPY